jgi:hypothetical protein
MTLFRSAAVLLVALCVAGGAPCQEKSIGESMVAFLKANEGKRIGGGECAQLVTEALRVSGGAFSRKNAKSPTDYIWSDNLVCKVEGKDGKPVSSDPSAKFLPGDVIQYVDARFSDGRIVSHHTSVVAAVDGKGKITQVYEQNVGVRGKPNEKIRHVVLRPFDLSGLSKGTVNIYRPDPRTPVQGKYEYSLVNNTDSSQTVTLTFGNSEQILTLDRANTSRSYLTLGASTSGTSKLSLKVGEFRVTVDDGGGYEIVQQGDRVVVRKLSR